MDQARRLEPLLYHKALRDYLKSQEPDAWNWFSSAEALSNYAESLRLDILKHTYRLDRNSHPELYEIADQVRTTMDLDVALTIYQSQSSSHLNAALFYLKGDAHIILEGQILSLLEASELKALLAHELSHYLLWQADDGEFLIADRIIQAMASDPRTQPPHVQSARRLSLYTEIYADRGSLIVTNDKDAAISTLVKIQTGLSKVSASSYIQQANEIFSQTQVRTNELTHPEAFIR
ncbi:MAG: M48 family metalloprotease, partial [Acidobacteriota bacterium]